MIFANFIHLQKRVSLRKIFENRVVTLLGSCRGVLISYISCPLGEKTSMIKRNKSLFLDILIKKTIKIMVIRKIMYNFVAVFRLFGSLRLSADKSVVVAVYWWHPRRYRSQACESGHGLGIQFVGYDYGWPLFLGKRLSCALFLDVLKSGSFKLRSRDKATIDAHGWFVSVLHII